MHADRRMCDPIGARGRGLQVKVPPDPSAGGKTVLTQSRGMGASAMLGLALVASYSALAAVALHGFGLGGGLLGLPGRALDAIVQVDAAHLSSPSRGYGNPQPPPANNGGGGGGGGGGSPPVVIVGPTGGGGSPTPGPGPQP